MKKKIETEILINAAPEKIWEILASPESFSEWNPFIRSLNGTLVEGNSIAVTLNPPDGGSFTFKPVVLRSKFPELRWKGKLLIQGLFDGEHYFRIESVSPQASRFVHGEEFSGVLVGLMGGVLEKTRRGFEAMNVALKKKAEQ